MEAQMFLLKIIARLGFFTTVYESGKKMSIISSGKLFELEFDEDGQFAEGRIYVEKRGKEHLDRTITDPFEMVDEIAYSKK
ncbi:MAG: hypothetical protein J5651_00405 [Salinivirgaceae bacterium]|nr:hypothetical protein [Salinivirgaceae bacterium]